MFCRERNILCKRNICSFHLMVNVCLPKQHKYTKQNKVCLNFHLDVFHQNLLLGSAEIIWIYDSLARLFHQKYLLNKENAKFCYSRQHFIDSYLTLFFLFSFEFYNWDMKTGDFLCFLVSWLLCFLFCFVF